MIRSIQFEKIGIAPTLPGFSLAASGIAGDQSLVFLFVEDSARQAVFECDQSAIGSFLRARMDSQRRFRLVKESVGLVQSYDLPPLDIAFPKVDTFPDGRILLVATRCSWRTETDYDLNGFILDPLTGQANRVLLGDGISDLQIDDRGRIWIAYFDEGIFGNYGWGGPGPAPVGQAGLVCFSDGGEKIWEFPVNADHMIDDCYALNVAGAEAAIFFYSNFPVCKIGADFKLSWWRTGLHGCHAFAMSETEILFSPQYRESPETAHLGRFAAGEIVDVKQVRLLMPDGSARSRGRLQGRGRHLYHFGEDGIYRATLS